MTWSSFYSAPLVFATMVPFWLLHTFVLGLLAGLPWREALKWAAIYAPFAATAVWVLLFVLFLGVIGGVQKW